MIGLNLLDEWWKISNYTKWYHYIWGMPLIAIIIGVAFVVISIAGIVSSFLSALMDLFKEIRKILVNVRKTDSD
ncbi:hypothetical protein [Bacillus cereus]|uniref:hypothetical protein n=1 Tax=Bacillus cereus TaxID=1396 RepID=UPI000279AE7E|nr:hypothetical protein [Bacillus cereus]EJR71374.1 hypothetical protein IK9_06025 [Bacillus cereus VD166]